MDPSYTKNKFETLHYLVIGLDNRTKKNSIKRLIEFFIVIRIGIRELHHFTVPVVFQIYLARYALGASKSMVI